MTSLATDYLSKSELNAYALSWLSDIELNQLLSIDELDQFLIVG